MPWYLLGLYASNLLAFLRMPSSFWSSAWGCTNVAIVPTIALARITFSVYSLCAIIALLALITGFAGPGEGIFRFSDLGVWMSVWLASVLAIMVYGMLFCTLGVMWKHGMVLALPFAAWELGMILTTLGAPDAAILRFSVIGWAMNIVDAGAALAWSDTPLMIQMGLWGGGNGSLEGAEALNIFWSRPGLDLGSLGTIIVSVFVLLFQTAACWLLGSTLFKSKEIE